MSFSLVSDWDFQLLSLIVVVWFSVAPQLRYSYCCDKCAAYTLNPAQLLQKREARKINVPLILLSFCKNVSSGSNLRSSHTSNASLLIRMITLKSKLPPETIRWMLTMPPMAGASWRTWGGLILGSGWFMDYLILVNSPPFHSHELSPLLMNSHELSPFINLS